MVGIVVVGFIAATPRASLSVSLMPDTLNVA
jgi:hypothetical protein